MPSYKQTVREFMNSPVVSVGADDPLADVHHTLEAQRVSSAPVVGRDGRISGVVSWSDLLQVGHIYSRTFQGHTALKLPSMCVGDLIKTRAITVQPTATLEDAAREMSQRRIHRLFVTEDEKPIGVLSARDVLRAVIEQGETAPISNFMTTPAPVLDVNATLEKALQTLIESKLAGVVLLDGKTVAGLFTQVEALAAREKPRDVPVGSVAGYSMICLPSSTPLDRAGRFALATRARRVVATANDRVQGILTGVDFIKVVSQE